MLCATKLITINRSQAFAELCLIKLMSYDKENNKNFVSVSTKEKEPATEISRLAGR